MSIEKKYQKLDDITHILKRSGMYVGSIKPSTSKRYIVQDGKMVIKEITYNPALIKIFDEIITNSVDEHKRKGSKLNTIKVNIDRNKESISIWDNGGIEVVKHKEYNEWIPEMVFSNLKAGSNFSDEDQRVTAGLNGVGSVLTNIFSKEFIVSTCDGKKSFYQTFRNNMRNRDKPEVKPSTKNHTQITFTPDLEKFGLDKIDDDHFKIIEKRVYDIAGCNPNLKVYLNGDLIQIKSFEDYIKFYTDIYHFETNKDKSWSVGISHADNGFNQVSFANSTETYDGGNHVDYIMNQIISELRDFFQKKHKVDIKPSELKSHISIFINSTIINPSFSSQTKEKLITESKDFGFTYPISDKLIKWVLKSEIVQSILDWIDQKKIADENKLARNLNKSLEKIKVEKLIDAKGKERWKCSLTIFEGDCLHEDTNIRILRNGDLIDCKIKDISIDDLVITHKNSFSNIYAITKKIKKKAIIKTLNDDIICSHSHKWFVYDTDINEFYFIETSKMKKEKHKLVRNYLAFTDSLIKIKNIDGLQIDLESGQVINCSLDHKFAMYDIQDNKFKMVSILDINKNIHFIVNTFKL